MIRSALGTLALVTTAVACTRPTGTNAESSRERVSAVVDSVARDAIGRKVLAGMVVLAMHGSDTLLARAYGWAEPENDVGMTVAHVYQLASITKQFTAAAILTLVQDGRVDLDGPIKRYLPDAPIQGRAITVRQLLSHTAGPVQEEPSFRDRIMAIAELGKVGLGSKVELEEPGASLIQVSVMVGPELLEEQPNLTRGPL